MKSFLKWLGIVIVMLILVAGGFVYFAVKRATGPNTLLGKELAWAEKWPTLTFPSRPTGATIVETKYDKFSDYTSISARIGMGETAVNLNLFCSWKGTASAPASPPREVGIHFLRVTTDTGTIRFLADGARMETYSSISGMTQNIATADLLAIANASTVEFETLGRAYTLSEENKRAIRDFLSMLKP